MGMELAGGIAGFLLLGWWIGRQFGRERAGMIVGAVIGCVGGMYNFIRRAIEMERQQDAGRHGQASDQHDDERGDADRRQ